MSGPQFTPGPWHVADGGIVWVEQPVPVAHQECCGNALPSGECCGNCIEEWHEELAQEQIAQCSPNDAHLIAAAPELYEALDAIMNERWSPGGRSEAVSDMARAALAKVRGDR